MISENTFVAVFKSHHEAENAVTTLHQAGFDIKKLSIVARGYQVEEHVVGYYNAGDRIKYWGTEGAFWGGTWALLFGSALFWVPGFGPLAIAGPLTTWIVAALENAVIFGGIGAVSAGLFSIGIPKDSILEYEIALKAGKFILIVNGTKDDTRRAKELVSGTLPEFTREHIWEAKSLPQHTVIPDVISI
jgi:hypothetical protein